MAYKTIFNKVNYTKFSWLFASDVPAKNVQWYKHASSVFGHEHILWKLVLLEEQFVGACACYGRLRTRSEKYFTELNKSSTSNFYTSSVIKELRADEYFIFSCCGYIWKELKNMEKIGNVLFQIDKDDWSKLEDLKEERRVHEHGKEWFWGEMSKKNPPVPTKGDNHDFEKNMQTLDRIYNNIYGQLIEGTKNTL